MNGNGTGVVYKIPYAPNSSIAGYLDSTASDPFSLDTPGLGFDQGRWDGGEPADDERLADILQNLVAGITGLDTALVRPRWQPEPANLPSYEVSWVSLGVVARDADTYAWTGHFPDGDGYDLLLRSENIEALLTFYGPHSGELSSKLRDGLQIDQNRAVLWRNEMELIECADIQSTAEFIKQQWIARSDVRLRVRRQIRRTYPILNLDSAQGEVASDTGAASSFDTTRLPKPGAPVSAKG